MLKSPSHIPLVGFKVCQFNHSPVETHQSFLKMHMLDTWQQLMSSGVFSESVLGCGRIGGQSGHRHSAVGPQYWHCESSWIGPSARCLLMAVLAGCSWTIRTWGLVLWPGVRLDNRREGRNRGKLAEARSAGTLCKQSF